MKHQNERKINKFITFYVREEKVREKAQKREDGEGPKATLQGILAV